MKSQNINLLSMVVKCVKIKNLNDKICKIIKIE